MTVYLCPVCWGPIQAGHPHTLTAERPAERPPVALARFPQCDGGAPTTPGRTT